MIAAPDGPLRHDRRRGRGAAGSVTVAMIFIRPPQRAHWSTSLANTRRINSGECLALRT